MENKFGVLRLIGNIFKILAVILFLLTVVGSLMMCLLFVGGGAASTSSSSSADLGVSFAVLGIFYGIFLFISGTVYSLILYAMGEGIFVFLGIEENTRATSLLLRRQLQVTSGQKEKSDNLLLE